MRDSRRPCASDLSTRSGIITLTGTDKTLKPLVSGESGDGRWRIVELVSLTLLPFSSTLTWSAGSGAGPKARITISRSTRIGVYARNVRVDVGNLSNSANQVSCLIADGFLATENQFEAVGDGTGGYALVSIPPFAKALRLEVSDNAQLINSFVRISDGAGTLRSQVRGDQQPAMGIPTGGAETLQVLVPAAQFYRVIFYLAL